MCETRSPEALPDIEEVVRFHGHLCPGLALGYRAAVSALQALQVRRPRDEELVAIAEGDACDVDAVQYVTGCTAGKGNLIVNPLGKHAFTFLRRDTGEAVRVVLRYPSTLQDPEFNTIRSRFFSGTASPSEREIYRSRMVSLARTLLSLPEEEILTLTPATIPAPRKARIYRSVTCERCGEACAEPMARLQEGRTLCLSCFNQI